MEQISNEQFRGADVQRNVEFDCDKHIRLLCRRGFLEVVPGADREEGACFRRGVWPPPVEALDRDGNVIGLAYYLQKWFRFHLQEWITRHARELEAKEGVYSLEAWNEVRADRFSGGDLSANNIFAGQVVNAEGDYTNPYGDTVSADVGMMRKPLDLSQMTLDWVKETEDTMFGDLSREDRMLLVPPPSPPGINRG